MEAEIAIKYKQFYPGQVQIRRIKCEQTQMQRRRSMIYASNQVGSADSILLVNLFHLLQINDLLIQSTLYTHALSSVCYVLA